MTQARQPSTTARPTTGGTETAPTSPSGNAALKSAARGAASFDQGAALLTPGAGPPVQMTGEQGQATTPQGGGAQQGAPQQQSGSASSFANMRTLVTRIAGGVVTGQFANVSINCAFPVPEVPGLSLTVGVSGSIATGSNGQKEFNCQLSGGAQYGLGRIFNINANINGSLQLTGADLGAALVDALKQSLRQALFQAGAETGLNSAHSALNNPQTRAQRLLAWGVGEEWIETFNRGYRGYFDFFQNNGATGFEASIGIQIGAGASAGSRAVSGSLEARTGLEDAAGNAGRAQAFTELAGQIQANSGNSQASVRFSKRQRSGGQTTTAIEVNAQLSMPATAYSPAGQRTFMSTLRDAAYLWKIISVGRALNNARGGANIGEALQLASTTASLASATFGNSGQAFDSLMGLELKVSETAGVWTVERARYKSMSQMGTGTGQSVGGVEANVQIGTFIDVTEAIATIRSLAAGG